MRFESYQRLLRCVHHGQNYKGGVRQDFRASRRKALKREETLSGTRQESSGTGRPPGEAAKSRSAEPGGCLEYSFPTR